MGKRVHVKAEKYRSQRVICDFNFSMKQVKTGKKRLFSFSELRHHGYFQEVSPI
ncbi:hypothetical protein [Chitinophaga arvensicola]|uniref:Uncharacterized protein n=1 Tax=Chitinophaga arvensicola TaxID=29529 RepID=A0A1I0Q4D7_9BACT|nr:hypothetical protein [Chitinophaga arvensicola]SEW21664.1 hypothetical protein SAMN04488122_1208 [Chitinophaga arvensicola]